MPRPAEASDLPSVHAIAMHPEVVGFLNVEPAAIEEFLPVFDTLLKAKSLFVHEVEGEVVGIYTMTRWPFRADHVATLGMVAIKPDLAGRGVARQMMVEAIEGLRAAGIRRVDLNVESGNTRAIAFYQRLGFEIEGTLRRGFRSSGGQLVDDRVMSLLLD